MYAAGKSTRKVTTMDLFTLRLHDRQLEQRFWDSWALPMLIGDVVDAGMSATFGTLILLHRLGHVRWGFVKGDLWWLVLAVVLCRLVNVAAVLLARRGYLRHRFTFHAALKLYMTCLSPVFLASGLPQIGPHSWAWLGGRDGRVESHQGIVRALLLPTGAYGCMNEMLLPPFRLPWRLMAPLHLLHGAGLIVASYPHIVRLLGLFPRLSSDARAICEAVHSVVFGLSGFLSDSDPWGACAGSRALSSTALFAAIILNLVVPLVYAYGGGWPLPGLPPAGGAAGLLAPAAARCRAGCSTNGWLPRLC